jgi:type I restriction enzyme M protein
MKSTFLKSKNDFDKKYANQYQIRSLVPVHGHYKDNLQILNNKRVKNEEYYKWQFIYSLIYSGFYNKENIGVEVFFPKGNPSSIPIKIDGAIFNDENWLEHYNNFWKNKIQDELDWLREHLIGVIEFKKEDGKDIEKNFNQQLKPAIKESEQNYVIGFYYDTERVWIFQKKNGKVLRYDESKNQKGEKSTIKDLSFHLPDEYLKIPSFNDIISKKQTKEIDRSKRKFEDLDPISGIHAKQINNAMSDILRTMDKVGLVNQRGYELLIQILALKIYDEKQCEHIPTNYLRFYLTDEELHAQGLTSNQIQEFITRMKDIFSDAKGTYYTILQESREKILWKDQSQVSAIKTIVSNFQDLSFVKSYKTDLYQLVFYRFANEFAKEQKGQFITPLPLIDFLVQIVNPRNGETVIDPTVGIADFLSLSYVNSNSKLDDNNLFGLDNDSQMIMLAQLNMLLNGDGNAKLMTVSDKGSITQKFDIQGRIVALLPEYHKKGDWNNWPDNTELKKFDVVLTNPPFGEDRAYKVNSQQDKAVAEMYELWHLNKQNNWIDLGLLFLENAVRSLKVNGRLGIVLSNSIASVDRWEKSRKWLMDNIRIVALFDLPPNVFADAGVNTTLVVGYKPENKEILKKLKEQNYQIFVKDIKKVGYEIRTTKRVKYFNPVYKINEENFGVETNEEGLPLLEEDFTETIKEFKEWAKGQEKILFDLFLKEK